jgi:hypothetical protein
MGRTHRKSRDHLLNNLCRLYYIKIDLRETRCENVYWIQFNQDMLQRRAVVNMAMAFILHIVRGIS